MIRDRLTHLLGKAIALASDGTIDAPMGRTPRTTRDVAMNESGLTAGGAGVLLTYWGRELQLSPTSHASAVLEVAFDKTPSAATEWVRMVPTSRARRPDGQPFNEFRVRFKSSSVPASAETFSFDLDPDPIGSVRHEGRFAQVSNGGGLETLIKALLRSSGAEVSLEAEAGSAATRGILRVSPIDQQSAIAGGAGAAGATTTRTVTATDSPDVTALQVIDDIVTGGRAKVDPIVGQAGVAAGVGATGVTVQRMVPAIPATAPSSRTSVPATSTSTQIAAANASRAAAMVCNRGPNVVYVAVGEAAAATSQPLDAGETKTFVGSGAINAFNSGAAACDVHVTDFTY